MFTFSIPPGVFGLAAMVLSAAVARALLPAAARFAFACGAVDLPGGRRSHRQPVPRLGGLAVVFAMGLTCLTLLVLLSLFGGVRYAMLRSPANWAMMGGAMMVFVVGLLDDLRGVSPARKLVVQTAAALVVVVVGGLPEQIVLARDLPIIHLGAFAPFVGVLWIVGVTNAFNLIDGLDGLAATCAVVALSTIVVSGYLLGQPSTFVFVLALLGALVAFLRLNWHPASMFLGDAGSMTIGFLLAVRAIPAATNAEGHLYALVPLAALSYPLLDTGTAILRRWLRGHSFSRADGRHIHHQMVTIGMSVPRAVRLIGILAMIAAVSGLLISFAPARYTVALGAGFSLLSSVLAVYGIWLLGYSEFIALAKAAYSGLARSRRVVRERIRLVDIARHMKTVETEVELLTCVRDLADGEHITRAELLVPPLGNTFGTDAEYTDPRTPNSALRIDCSVALPHENRSMILRVWLTPLGLAHHSVQRIENMIRPELETWYDKFSSRSASSLVVVHAPTSESARAGAPAKVIA